VEKFSFQKAVVITVKKIFFSVQRLNSVIRADFLRVKTDMTVIPSLSNSFPSYPINTKTISHPMTMLESGTDLGGGGVLVVDTP
jgi:hypothetical protein